MTVHFLSTRPLTWLPRWRGFVAAGLLVAWPLFGRSAPPGADDRERLAVEANAFVDELASEDFESAVARFDEVMAGMMPSAKLAEAWTAVQRGAGRFTRRVGTRVTRDKGFDIAVVTCRFAGAVLDVRVVFSRHAEVAGLWFAPHQAPSGEYEPPDYVKAESFDERAIEFGEAPWRLPGTLTIPRGAGPFPALVLVHGSGPLDRDESVGPNKPFRDLAHGLASRGVAVLRYDKRTLAHGRAMQALAGGLTVKEETVDDAVAAFEFARRQPEIDASSICFLGHSLGGMLIPRIGLRTPQAAGFIVLAGTARPLEEVVLDQVRYLAGLDPAAEPDTARVFAELEQQVERVKDPGLSADTAAEELLLGVPAVYWLDLRDYQPTQAARSLGQPLLILQGGRDYQVTDEDFRLWQGALSDRTDVTFKRYSDLDHLFRPGTGRATPAGYEMLGHVAEVVIEDIAAWMRAQRPRQGAGAGDVR